MTGSWHESLGIRWPIVQAAMGGGISTADLAIAVSRAGGLGTVGLMPEDSFAAELARAEETLGEIPFAANLLMPMLRRGHLRVCLERRVPVVSVFFGHDPEVVKTLKAEGRFVIYQVGSESEADKVVRDGADALIVQGMEAGGHVRSTERLETLLPKVRKSHPGIPILAAGGIHDTASVRWARGFGADGVAVGTRFLLTPESNAHEAYKRCLVEADETMLTNLFGLGWNAPHRVAPNDATRRWCRENARAPRWLAGLNALSEVPGRLLSMRVAASLVRGQRVGLPFFSPSPLTRGMPERTGVTPLYAGECVARIGDIRPAGEIVRELARGFSGS